ncbi:MAG TPA: class I SAM-dependent methyltransferase [Pyrinomonadaceae bacterium]|jgi:ubiquinone/menaquinone biosynthesis C-methylase UbiE|nr:class I SAM-dependent methyltransferase [Pyrinomonadaceae bacterium]
MSKAERKLWSASAHERKVENLYSGGVENFADWHNGYLNFGLWENGNAEYIKAAENLVHRMGSILGLNESSTLLDVAPGMGTQDIYLLKNFAPRSIDGLDVTWKHIEHGRRRSREAGAEDRVRFHHGTAIELPFPDESFTHVLSIEGPEHFDTREKFLHEARRVLQPGGVIAMADFIVKNPPRNPLEKLVAEAARKLWQVPRANVYSAEVYNGKMRAAGFENVEIQEIGASVIPGYYFEQMRPETIRALSKIRGFALSRLGLLLDIAVYRGFTMGLLEYVLVRGVKS